MIITQQTLTLMKNVHEYIICSAIWYCDLKTQNYLPININKGLVVCGHRHHNCIDTLKTMSDLRTVRYSPDGVGESIQGFLTNKNRFLNRIDAMEIAIEAKQVNKEELYNPKIGLFSEDLW